MNYFITASLVLSAACVLPAPASAQTLDAETIVQRSVEAASENYKAAPRYNYFKVVHERDGGSRIYEEIMLYGSRYSRLISVNGEPLSPQRQAEEQQKLEAATRARSSESPEERAKRVSGYERERQRDQDMLMEMVNAFTFTLQGEETLNSHPVYVLKAKPRKGYRAPNNRAKVLTGMEGTLWIEKNTFQWVRVEAEVIHAVSIEGFLARVQPGTRFEMDQIPVSEFIWLPRHFAMQSHARILFFFSKHDEEDEDYFGYTPHQPSPTPAQPTAESMD
jgi:hypothetical protein